MAKDVITRFKLETTAFDSKIKQAAKGLSDYSKTATNAGKDFDKFTKSNVEAARALGTMATSSNNAKGKVQELVGAYNELVKTYEHLTNDQKQSDFAKAMAESMTILQQRIKDTKQELYGLGDAAEQVKSKSSGLFGDGGFTGILAVTGGNLLASGIQKLGSEMVDTIQQSVELARQGEGVRIAFERLNRPDLLDNLKEATHGTVSELELMKAAIKFDNFKLPLEDLGTYLAFAQQKAQDTGDSVDNMVTSIVNGLGRQSVQILDNLGISAAEIRNRMKEGGDMTQVVAQIIREEMTKAGEYVETAATRAARAAADATNEMERLGREAQPFAEAWAGVWNEIKIGGMDLLTTVFGPLAESARQIRNILNGGGFKFKAGIPNLAEGPAQSPSRQPGTDHKVNAKGGYVVVTDTNTGAVIGGQHFDNLQDTNGINTWKKTLFKTGGGKNGKKTNVPTYAADSIAAQQALVSELTKKWNEASQDMQQGYVAQLVVAEAKLREMKHDAEVMKDLAMGKFSGQGFGSIAEASGAFGLPAGITMKTAPLEARWLSPETLAKANREAQKTPKSKTTEKQEKSAVEVMSQMNSGINQIAGGIEGLGIKLPEELSGILGGINSMLSILQGITILVQGIAAMQEIGTFLGILSNGGIVPHAAGGRFIGGNSYSGDNIYAGNAWVNSGELVLNRAQQGNLASQLQGGGLSGLNLTAEIRGEQIRLVMNNNGRRTGRGEVVQTNRR